MRDHPLRQIVGLYLVCDRKLLQLGRQAPMPADYALEHALMREMVEALFLAVALASGIDERQVARLALRVRRFAFACKVTLLQRDCDLLGKPDADKAAGGNGVVVANEQDGFCRCDDLAL